MAEGVVLGTDSLHFVNLTLHDNWICHDSLYVGDTLVILQQGLDVVPKTTLHLRRLQKL
jgi:hypothetical protein